MSLNLPRPASQYSAADEGHARAILERNDKELMRKTQDVQILKRRLILQSPNGDLWSVTVSNTGTLSATAL